MLVRVVFVSALVVAISACRGSEASPDPIDPVWPPQEAEYCGDAPDVCDANGRPWLCGARPLWRLVDCDEYCGSRGMEFIGCLVEENASRRLRAPTPLEVPYRDAVESRVPAARCLCGSDDALDIECSGPEASVCADRNNLWSCDDSLHWRFESCEALCANLDPPLASTGCDPSGASNDPRIAACGCSVIGAPCEDEEEIWCQEGTWLSCEEGVMTVQVYCSDVVACTNQEVAVCDHRSPNDAACMCTQK